MAELAVSDMINGSRIFYSQFFLSTPFIIII
nr:MAG TPA: hypothetical protein [Caudoviricetes sp.]